MNHYQFTDQLSQSIVDGILDGYKNYLAERKEKKRSMAISSAYAWVKGNHIEHAVTQSDKSLKYEISKAGYAWGYLQFIREDEKILFIIKNGIKDGEKVPSKVVKDIETNYLAKLAKINKDANFETSFVAANKKVEYQMSFMEAFPPVEEQFEAEVTNLSSNFDRFYVISYRTDENKMISNVELIMPNPNDGKYYKVDDWTELLGKSSISVTAEELEVIKDEDEAPSENVATGDYLIVDVSEEKSKE